MNKIFIIGNLTHDPELRSTDSGVPVCSFTVAVNRRKGGAEAGKQDTDFMRVNAWRELGELCKRYMRKGGKAAVVGTVKVSAYTGQDGQPRAQIIIDATEVEFLSPKQQERAPDDYPDDEMPFGGD